MGPPLYAAEDSEQNRRAYPYLEASMGPPLYAAEDVVLARWVVSLDPASMGPPLYAAEDHEATASPCHRSAYVIRARFGRPDQLSSADLIRSSSADVIRLF